MKRLHRFFLFLCIFFLFSKADFISASTVSQTKIHFISLNSTSDAILLESNGHYGMVDSGEDWDYPNSSSYPFRTGISTGIGFEQQVIHYLKTVGVKKLDFYIATHAHSDHIGSGDEILRHFPTDRLYINRYDDSYMLDSHGTDPSDPYYIEDAQENRLWDNQYIYDCLIEAAQDTGTQIITDLDLDENASYRSFTLGDMQIEIMNYERLRDDNGNYGYLEDSLLGYYQDFVNQYNSLKSVYIAFSKNPQNTSALSSMVNYKSKMLTDYIQYGNDMEDLLDSFNWREFK